VNGQVSDQYHDGIAWLLLQIRQHANAHDRTTSDALDALETLHEDELSDGKLDGLVAPAKVQA